MFTLSLLIAVQLALFFAIDIANTRNAIFQINQALNLTKEVFNDALNSRKTQLIEKARLLSSDYAFKKTFSSNDFETILSVLENHQTRVGADIMMLLDFEEGDIIANTADPGRTQTGFSCPILIDQAYHNEQGESSIIKIFGNKPYQFVIVPLFTPEPSAWIVIGFVLGDQFAHQLREITQTHVSILRSGEVGQIYASTLTDSDRVSLEQTWPDWLRGQLSEKSSLDPMVLGDEPYVSNMLELSNAESEAIYALLQRPLNQALEAYLGVRNTFVLVFLSALVICFLGVLSIARSVTKPVSKLVSSAKRIEEGDYTQPVNVGQQDELGRLALSFNQMMKGLAERRQVRSLLGKVVSPAIADELLKKDIELGGEERKVSVLFSDVRNFTSLCEGRAPKDILDLLNRYLTKVSDVIEKHDGVIDKYIGDAVMALFGAPIQRDGDATRAILAAQEMCGALDDLNIELEKDGKPLLAVGVGINTDVVVAGNMGSKARLNYTVIGDGVNLASRLEGLTKQYGVDVIVSESTKSECSDIVFRELDKVKVKGKLEPVLIYEPVSLIEFAEEHILKELSEYQRALDLYRDKEWEQATEALETLLKNYCSSDLTSKLYEIYLDRITQFKMTPPPDDWDGSYVFTTK